MPTYTPASDDIEEYVYEGLDNTAIWYLQDDSAVSGTQAPISTAGSPISPTRFVALLKNVYTGAEVDLDTDDVGVTLGVGGHFEWSTSDSTVTLRLGDLVPDTIAIGVYDVDLTWYDATNTNGIRWGREDQKKQIIVTT